MVTLKDALDLMRAAFPEHQDCCCLETAPMQNDVAIYQSLCKAAHRLAQALTTMEGKREGAEDSCSNITVVSDDLFPDSILPFVQNFFTSRDIFAIRIDDCKTAAMT